MNLTGRVLQKFSMILVLALVWPLAVFMLVVKTGMLREKFDTPLKEKLLVYAVVVTQVAWVAAVLLVILSEG